MLDPTHSYDCAVIGGGPSGALLATKLSEWGHKVAIIHRPSENIGAPAETLRPEAKAILRRNGLMASVRAHDAYGTTARGLIWGDGEMKWRECPLSERGFQVEAGAFRSDLRNFALSQGTRIYGEHRALGPLPVEGRGAFEIEDTEGKRTRVFARMIAVAAGRQVLPELLPLSLRQQLPRTRALHFEFPAELAPRTFQDATVMESVEAGWFSWLSLSDGRISLSLHVDEDELRVEGATALWKRSLLGSGGPLQTEIAKRPEILDSILAWSPENGGHDSPQTAQLLETSSDLLLVGDSASTIDSLTGEGLEKSLRSAEQAAVAVNTVLQNEELREDAILRHRATERELWQELASRSLGFYLKEARFAEARFWRSRHDMVKVEVETPGDPAELPTSLQVHPSVVTRPALRRKGNVYVRAKGYAIRRSRTTHESLGRVPLEPLMSRLGEGARVRDVLESARSDPRLYLVSPRNLVQTLTELLRLGMIVESQEHPKRG